MKTNYQAIRFGGRCLSSTFFLCFTLLSANAFGEAPNPDKMAQVDLQAPAQLAPIVNLGDLDNTPFTDGDGFQGDALEGDNTGNPDAWDYWRFCATEGDEITIETHRTTSAMDPSQQICEGTAADTTGIVAFSSCGPDMLFVASADDNNGIPHGVGGAFADPISVFIAPSTGEYTLAVWDFLGAGPGPTVPYEIHLDGVTPCNPLSKEIVGGNDVDGDGATDLVVEVGILTPSMYDFKLTYDGDDPVLIEDTIPAEWDVMIPDAVAAGYVPNGDFEIGDFTDWSQINIDDGGIVIDDGTYDPAGPGGPVAPFEGSYGSATWQGGPGYHVLYQDVDVPEYGMPTLVWADHIENWAGNYSIPNQQWRVEVWDPADDSVMAILRETLPGDPLQQPWTEYTADLSPWAGMTVRIAFVEQDNLSFFNARLDAVDVVNDPNMLNCVLRSANGKDNGKSATLAECLPEAEGMTWFWTEARCHDNRNNTKCRPTSCGALYLNDGAEAYEEWDFDSKKGFPEGIGDPSAVSNNLCLAAVEDVNGDGVIDYTGNGDEDNDGALDHEEACSIGTDPCNDDTDGDGVLDGADECPLEGPADPSAGEILDPNGCIRQSQCSDGADNDGDALIDYPADPGCDNLIDDDEFNAICDTPFVCGDPIPECTAGSGAGCFCVGSTEGNNECVADNTCGNLGACGNSNDCNAGEACIVNTCCGGNVCMPVDICLDPTSAPAANFSDGGPTVTGQ